LRQEHLAKNPDKQLSPGRSNRYCKKLLSGMVPGSKPLTVKRRET
jgi:hypothetical protein